jgi:hypothetical protein
MKEETPIKILCPFIGSSRYQNLLSFFDLELNIKSSQTSNGTGRTPITKAIYLGDPDAFEGFPGKGAILISFVIDHGPQVIMIGNPVRALPGATPAKGAGPSF